MSLLQDLPPKFEDPMMLIYSAMSPFPLSRFPAPTFSVSPGQKESFGVVSPLLSGVLVDFDFPVRISRQSQPLQQIDSVHDGNVVLDKAPLEKAVANGRRTNNLDSSFEVFI